MNPSSCSDSSRREFLHGMAALGTVAVPGVFSSFLSRVSHAKEAALCHGFGRLVPTMDRTTGLPLLMLPEGFEYLSFGWWKDPMCDGRTTPGAHDGMAVIGEWEGIVTLCRNHEITDGANPIGERVASYDVNGGGGCTNLRFDTNCGEWIDSRVSLSGTSRNCAGGPTPWGTWLSCEETVLGPGDLDNKKPTRLQETHGWVFEVSAEGQSAPVPLKAMGRFVHEAIAVDPRTGWVYETEDRGTSGFYRFIPHELKNLAAGGALFMMRVKNQDDVRTGMRVGQTMDVDWVPIEDPERAHSPGEEDTLGVFLQGKAQSATTFARLEGCWYGNEKIYVNATSGGNARAGQVWQYDPREETLTLIFESPSRKVLDAPDNIVVSPRGGRVICEDGDTVPQRLHGLTPDGRLFDLAANNIQLKGEVNGFQGDFRGQEWCGATFSQDGRWLFVNIQTPGVTFAITGPWSAELV